MNKGEIHLSFDSDFSFLDAVQSVSDNVGQMMGFDSEALYWIGLALRESVTNAIQHGNKLDRSKSVEVRFKVDGVRLIIFVRDHGEGLRESDIPDPRNPENLLKPDGRGIFFVRSFMDKVSFRVHPEGGLLVRMEKRLNSNQGEDNEH